MGVLIVLAACAIGWFVWNDTGSTAFGLLIAGFAALVLWLVVKKRAGDGTSVWGIGEAGDACGGD